MHDEAHCDDFDDCFQCEYVGKNQTKQLNVLIVTSSTISVLVIKASKHDGVDQDERNDEVIKPWPAG
jgi:hypothetical protein